MPSWSADGQRLAMVRQGQIFKAEVSGSDPPAVDTSTIQQLTTTGRFFHPDLSPNGETVAYRNTTGDTVGVWLTPVDDSTRRSFFAYGGTPDWFPDGKRLLYPRDGEIWIRFFNRSTAERIRSNLSGVIGSPTVSPTGDEIGFYTETSEGPTALYVIGSAGTHFRQISPPFSYALDWSPDGERLVFLRWGVNENHDFPGSGHLWTIRRDGSDLRQLTGR